MESSEMEMATISRVELDRLKESAEKLEAELVLAHKSVEKLEAELAAETSTPHEVIRVEGRARPRPGIEERVLIAKEFAVEGRWVSFARQMHNKNFSRLKCMGTAGRSAGSP